MHLDPAHFECYFLRATPELSSEVSIEGDVIWSRGEESYVPGLLNKTLRALEIMEPRLDEFDYVLRTNLSSFYVFPRLLHFLQDAPAERFYSGIHHGEGAPMCEAGWVCGAGILMSTDLARTLIAHKVELFDLEPCRQHLDDVVIGALFAANDIPIQPGHYREIHSMKRWNQVIKKNPKGVFHFRIKNPDDVRSTADLFMQRELLKKFYDR